MHDLPIGETQRRENDSKLRLESDQERGLQP